MTTFDKREQGFEAKYIHDEELRSRRPQGATKCWEAGQRHSSD